MDGPTLLRLGRRRWLLRSSRQRVPRSLLLPKHSKWLLAPASRRTAPAPPLPFGCQQPLLDPGVQQRAFRTTCSSTAQAPPPWAATGGLHFFLLPDLLSTAIPLSSEGSLTASPSFLPGFGTNVMQFVDCEEGGGNRRNFQDFSNLINTKEKRQPLTDDCRTQNTK